MTKIAIGIIGAGRDNLLSQARLEAARAFEGKFVLEISAERPLSEDSYHIERLVRAMDPLPMIQPTEILIRDYSALLSHELPLMLDNYRNSKIFIEDMSEPEPSFFEEPKIEYVFQKEKNQKYRFSKYQSSKNLHPRQNFDNRNKRR